MVADPVMADIRMKSIEKPPRYASGEARSAVLDISRKIRLTPRTILGFEMVTIGAHRNPLYFSTQQLFRACFWGNC